MHEKCHERCEMLMKTKCNIIVDNTNITCKEMMPYVQLGLALENFIASLYFRWLEISVIEIGKASRNSLSTI